MSGTLSNMKSFNVRHIQHHLAAVLAELEGSEVIEVQSATPFAPRPDSREACGENGDERVADLHHAHTPGHAASRSISADWDLWWIAPEMRHCCIRVLWIGPECIAGNVEMHRLAHFPGHPKSKCTRQCISRAPEVVHRQRASEPVGPGIRELPVALYWVSEVLRAGTTTFARRSSGFPPLRWMWSH